VRELNYEPTVFAASSVAVPPYTLYLSLTATPLFLRK